MEDSTTKKVYLAIKGDAVIYHTDKQAMLEMDGIAEADMEISDEEFVKAGYLVRLIDGKIFLGKTDAEKAREEAIERICILKGWLAETDYIAAKIAEGAATATDYAEKIAQRKAWRKEISELESA